MNIMMLMFSFTTGGTERLVSDICNNLVEDNSVYLYIVNDLYEKEMLDSLDGRVKIILQNRKAGSNDKIKSINSIYKCIKKYNIEVVHCNSFDAPFLLIKTRVLLPNVKIVHTIHGLGHCKNSSKGELILRNWLCDKFIAVSQSVKADIIDNGLSKKKVQVIYNAINIKKFINKPKHNIDLDHICIGNVARIMPEIKGQDILIRAIGKIVKKYPNLKCYFAGDADLNHKSDLKDLKEMVRELQLENNIKFLGNVDNIPEFLKKLDVFILPSRSEGFGLSLVEAIASGIPCIASKLDGPLEILGSNERGIIFESENVEKLVNEIQYVIENYDLVYNKSCIAQQYVIENYNISNTGKKLRKLDGEQC